MLSRIIINNHSEKVDDEEALRLVMSVVNDGLVSETAGEKHYCAVNTFGTADGPDKIVYAGITHTGTHVFHVMDFDPKNWHGEWPSASNKLSED